MKCDLLILGAGESGVSAALLAQEKGYQPFVSDSGTIRPEMKKVLEKEGIPYEESGHQLPYLQDTKEVIKSPGIPDSAEVIRRCEALGLPIISEIEFAARYTAPKQLISITGSNGKTTTTTLIDLALHAAGEKSIACGNIGDSLAREVLQGGAEIYTMELSSFQLDHMYHTHSHISLLLNITPDHLDRYDHQLINYARAKWRVFQNQGAGDYAIINADDPHITELQKEAPLQAEFVKTFSTHNPKASAYFDGRLIHFEGGVTYDYSQFRLKGQHNAENIMAVGLALQAYGIDISRPEVRESLATFGGVRHRTQLVGTWHGITFINDSKGTNLDATAHALGAMPDGKTVLLLGGTDKGNDYSLIFDLVKAKSKALIYLTLDTAKLHHSFDCLALPTSEAHSMAEAFRQIELLELSEGDVVLLSPACASFDLFKNYEDRGDQFIQAFEALS